MAADEARSARYQNLFHAECLAEEGIKRYSQYSSRIAESGARAMSNVLSRRQFYSSRQRRFPLSDFRFYSEILQTVQ
jgi:hypothetical protein